MLEPRFALRRFLTPVVAPALLSGLAIAQDGAVGPRQVPGAGAPQQPAAQPSTPQEPASARYEYQPVHSRYLRLEPFDRYGRRSRWNPLTMSDGTGEYPILRGAGIFDVYNTNKWKGDEPIYGENTFFAAELISNNLFESRDKAGVGVTLDDETELRSTEFLTVEMFHGDTVFRPPTWRVRSTLAADFRDVDNNNVTDGVDSDGAVQELFAEALLWETDPYLDFGSIRVGRQAFASDFRNFIFADNNDGVQLFGTFNESKIDYQVAFFDLVAKDPVSNLNRGFESRDQTFLSANVFFEDLIAEGYKVEATLQWAHDTAVQDGTVDAYYLGFNGEGRIGKVEVAHALYYMFGQDDQNLVTGAQEDIGAYMLAAEVAVPDDWRRYVFSALYASGDSDSNDGKGEGFDSVFDNPVFAGGAFGFFHRQAIAGIVNTNSFYPNLRTKANNAPNSVNPGLIILHAGCEADLSNYWSVAANGAYLQFADTSALETQFATSGVGSGIGLDLSIAAKYRPLGVDNLVITPGIQMLVPVGGLKDLTGEDALLAVFVNAVIVL